MKSIFHSFFYFHCIFYILSSIYVRGNSVLQAPCITVISSNFQEEVAKEFGIPVQFQRFWIWAKRQNHTYRPNRPLTPHEEAQSVIAF